MERLTFTGMKQGIIEMLDKVETYKEISVIHCFVGSVIEIEQEREKGFLKEGEA